MPAVVRRRVGAGRCAPEAVRCSTTGGSIYVFRQKTPPKRWIFRHSFQNARFSATDLLEQYLTWGMLSIAPGKLPARECGMPIAPVGSSSPGTVRLSRQEVIARNAIVIPSGKKPVVRDSIAILSSKKPAWDTCQMTSRQQTCRCPIEPSVRARLRARRPRWRTRASPHLPCAS